MAELIKIYEDKPNSKVIREVVEVIKKGGLVIFPSDTVYGLGCDIKNNKALEKVARIKGVKLEKANFSFICEDLSNLSDSFEWEELFLLIFNIYIVSANLGSS